VRGGGARREEAARDFSGERRMKKIVLRFANAQSGVTAVEYALAAMCIVLAIVVSVALTGSHLNNTYSEISGSFN
jgi:Flp pilus assembly pilin Flp